MNSTPSTPLLTNAALQSAAEQLDAPVDQLTVRPVSGGFSRNRRAVVSAAGQSLFVKEVDIELLPDDGLTELGWLKKDYEVVRTVQQMQPELVADWVKLSDDGHALMMTNYAPEDGWLWQPPTDRELAQRYVEAVVNATRGLETVRFESAEMSRLQLQPFIQREMTQDRLLSQLVQDRAMRQQLQKKYQTLMQHSPSWQAARCQKMIDLLGDDQRCQRLLDLVENLPPQPDDCFNHCDVRSDNLAFHTQTGQVKLVDWNWASYAPRGYGATEFLLDMARLGHDVTPWFSEINQQLLLLTIGFYAGRAIKPPMAPGNNLRDMQALTAAAAYEIAERIAL